MQLANGMPCSFYPNASPDRLAHLYASSAVLVHATGFGVDKYAFPERLEHFGITPVEAASQGCIPVVYGEGGAAEVLDLPDCKTAVHSKRECVGTLARLPPEP